jgi:hypothetical protein
MLLLPLPLLLLLVRLNLLVLFPGALPLASAGVGGYLSLFPHVRFYFGTRSSDFIIRVLHSVPLVLEFFPSVRFKPPTIMKTFLH